MRNPLGAALLALLLALPAQAQVVSFVGGGAAADLQCPPKKGGKRPAPPPTARPAPTEAEEGVLEPPDLDELEGVLPAEANTGRDPVFKPAPHPASRLARIGIWGDSHLAAHFFQDELLRLAGVKRARVLPTFLPPTMGRGGVRLPIRKACQGEGWSLKSAYVAQNGSVFGPGLVQLRSQTADAYLWIDFRQQPGEAALNSLDILFTPEAGATQLGVTVDDEEEKIVALDAESGGKLKVQADKPFSVVKLRLVEGSLVLEGFKPAYVDTPIARLDTMAVPGAMMRGWANANPDYVRKRLGDDDYDFVVLEYGTNEGNQRNFNEAAYTADLRASLTNMRKVFPNAQCLLIGPTDRGVLVRHVKDKKDKKGKRGKKKAKRAAAPRPKADLLRYARIHQQIGDIERKVGAEYGCGFWNWQNAMGGPGGAYRWLYQNPRLMAKDLIHLTIPGYQQSAREFYDAVRFAEWLTSGNSAQ